MKNSILLVEDDPDLGMVLKQYLEFSDFEVSWFTHPDEVLIHLEKVKTCQLAILDVMLPGINGFELAQKLKVITEIPFLFLTAKGQSIDRILGLKLGADDYITKPCEPEELILRIGNILRRSSKEVNTEVIPIGHYTFMPKRFQLSFGDQNFQLTEKEAELLLLLSQKNHQLVGRKEILEKLWGENDYFFGRSLDVFMTRLRKYLNHDERIKFESVRGIGFMVSFPDQ